jgi:carbonic anhydrase
MKSIFLLCIPVFLLIGSCKRNHSLQNKSLTEQLLDGNKRFAAGCPTHPDDTPNRRRAIENKQNPFVAVISCSDSRVSPEIIFDQGLGSIFSIRTAGNVIGDLELGSVEYAIEHLNCKLVVVLGHDHCGAIEAYLSHSKHSKHFGHIEKIIEYSYPKKLILYYIHSSMHMFVVVQIVIEFLYKHLYIHDTSCEFIRSDIK